MTASKKRFLHLTMALALTVSIAQCAWAGFNDNKLALSSDYGSYEAPDEDYIINADSPEAQSVPSSTRLTGNIQIAGQGQNVTISLRDADVKQVLRMIADKAKLNVIFHSSAQGQVTLDLKDVSINDALEFVLDACELSYIRQGKSIIVLSKEVAKTTTLAKQNMITIPVKYVNAQFVANFLNENMFNGSYQGVSAQSIVAVNPAKNELLIFGTDTDAKLAERVLEKLDTKPMMNTFTVNHVTPQEMASTICSTLLSDMSEGGSDSANNNNIDTNSNNGDEDEITLGGGYVACVAGENGGSINNSGGSGTEGEVTNFISNPLTVAFFPELGTVTTYGGSREQVKTIESFIKLHDKKQPMAYIELSLIQLSESGSKQFNTEWRIWTPLGTFNFDSNGITTDPNGQVFLKGSAYSLVNDNGEIIRTYSKNHGWGPIVMSLNYLVSNGKGRVLASPKVMVTNGQKSTIDLTSDYVKRVNQQYDTNSTTAVAQTTYEIADDNGIKVDITPFISPDGYVVLNLKPDYATISEQVDNYTLLARRNLELNNIRVKDGETLVLAGLIQEDERQNVTKIPLLGDLPVVGPFFRRTSNNLQKEELVILITPHIVYSKEQIDKIKSENL